MQKAISFVVSTLGITSLGIVLSNAAEMSAQATDQTPFFIHFLHKLSGWIGDGLSLIPKIGFLPSVGSIWGMSSVAFAFLTVFIGIMWLIIAKFSAKREAARAFAKVSKLQEELDDITAILTSDASLLFVWERQETAEPRVFGALPTDFGVPELNEHRANLTSWLEFDSAFELGENIASLRVSGKPFNVIITTKAQKVLEADGCVSGAKATLRFKDLPERQHEQAREQDEYSRISAEAGRYFALLDTIPTPVWVRNMQGNLEWANQAYIATVKGTDLAHIVSRQIELMSVEQRAAAKILHDTGQEFNAEDFVEIGAEKHSFKICERVFGQDILGFAVDQNATKGLREQLQQVTDTRSQLLDHMKMAVAQFGADQRLIYTNEAFTKLWNIKQEDLARRPSDGEILDMFRDKSLLEERVDFRSWRAGRLRIYDKKGRNEELWHLPDGRSIQVTAETQKSGGVIYFYEETTEKLNLESRYNELINVQRETLDNLQEAAALFGSDGKLRLFNPAYAKIWKLNTELLDAEPHIDDVIEWCRTTHNDEAIWEELKLAVTGVGEQRLSLRGRLDRLDNTVVDFATVPLPDGATLLTYDDISDTVQIERALTERNEALMAADRLKSEFISHVSYQLRTPLTTIIGFSESLAMGIAGDLTYKQREYADDIRASSDELLALIDDILDLATIDAGAMHLNIDDVDVADVMQSAARVVKDQVNAVGAQFRISIPGNIGSFRGDEKRIKQMLFNLLSNSLAFTSTGGTISLKAMRTESSIEFIVTDTGSGIDPSDQQRVFDRFETQADNGTSRGAGLGLSIVKSFVELHGGSISLKSVRDRGTRITCTLPLVPPQEIELQAKMA